MVESAGLLGLTQQFASTNCHSETELDASTKRFFTLSGGDKQTFEQHFGSELINRLKLIGAQSTDLHNQYRSDLSLSTTENSVLYPSLSSSFQSDFDVSRINGEPKLFITTVIVYIFDNSFFSLPFV